MTKKKVPFALLAFLLLIAPGCDDKGEDDDGPSYNIDEIAEEAKLKNIYAGKFLIGNIINNTYMSGNHNKYLLAHYNTVTCENDMKPDYLAPSSKGGSYNWEKADNMVDAMIAAGMKVHGHTLVWHRQTPSWMTNGSKEEVTANLEKYITDVIKHFEGRVTSWDVVNEAIKGDFKSADPAPTGWKDVLRTDSPWYQALGADYVEIAFKAAREAAGPDVKLYYNDYGMNVRNKGIAVYNLIKDINTGKKLIDGMGMQGHYGLYIPEETLVTGITYYDNVKYALERFISLGITVDISELDVTAGADQEGTGKSSAMSSADQKKQAEVYAMLFRLFREHSDHITRVTMWGLDDKTSWKSAGNPCLFDGNLKPKPAFWAVSNPDAY